MSIFGGLVGVIASLHSLFINSFYADPSEAAGKYTVKRRSTTKYQQNILTGKSAIIEKGYQFQITQNSEQNVLILVQLSFLKYYCAISEK